VPPGCNAGASLRGNPATPPNYPETAMMGPKVLKKAYLIG